MRDVIDNKYLPARLPFTWTGVVWLMLDRYPPPGWVQGVVWTIVVIVWFACLYHAFAQRMRKPKFAGD